MHAQDWYHATPTGDRVGPMTRDDLVRLYQAGRIASTTPVWCSGMAGWTPLASAAVALGLPPLPPPIPVAAPPQLPPRRGLHWAWIVLLVLLALLVPVIAILAAIAVPAYNDYRIRAGMAEIAATSAPLRVALHQAAVESGACPVLSMQAEAEPPPAPSDGLDIALSSLHTHRHVKYVLTNGGETSDACVIRIGLRGFDRPDIDDRALSWTLDPTSGGWTCRASVANRYLPGDCRT